MTIPTAQDGTSAAAQSRSSSDLILVEATREQYLAVRAAIYRDHQHWRRGRAEEDYWIAEETMTGAKLAERRAWVLVPQDDRTTLDFRCTSLTFRFEGLVAYPSSSTSSHPTVNPSPIYLIGGVFTPSPHRGLGLGGVMMRLLHEKLRPLGSPPHSFISKAAAATAVSPVTPRADGSQYGNDAVCSVLWSDIGTWYERNGAYKIRTWSDTLISTLPADAPLEGEEDIDYIRPEVIPQRFASLAEDDGRLIAAELEQLATTATGPIVSLVSNKGESWRYSALQCQLQVRFQHRAMPQTWGCQLRESSVSSWAVWAYDLKPLTSGLPSSLNVLRHRASSAEALYRLLQAARKAASAVDGCDRVMVWNIEDNSSSSSQYWPEVKARLEGEGGAKLWTQDRFSKPALAWYRQEGDNAVVRSEDAEAVRWINAEVGYCLAT